MNKPKKLSFIERCVYFFDLRAYEKRLHGIDKEFQQKNTMLEEMLIDVLNESVAEERMLEICAHITYLKNKRKTRMAMFELENIK